MAEAERSTQPGALAEAFAETRRERSGAQRALRMLRRNRLGVIGAVILSVVVFAAIFAPLLAPYDPVRDGDIVAIEGFTHLICFAAAHELIRQRRRALTLCRLTPDLVADQMIAVHAQFDFRLVIMVGDNFYGSQAPAELVKKFDRPYKPLLEAGVTGVDSSAEMLAAAAAHAVDQSATRGVGAAVESWRRSGSALRCPASGGSRSPPIRASVRATYSPTMTHSSERSRFPT
jgi:hypothetical protein